MWGLLNMTIGEQNRDKSYMDLIENNKLGEQEEAVLRMFHLYPDKTSQFIADMLMIPLASVNGRRNSLMEKGLLIESGTDYQESNIGRTTYRVNFLGDSRANKKDSKGCLSAGMLERFERQLLSMRLNYHKANEHQRKRLLDQLKLTVENYEDES